MQENIKEVSFEKRDLNDQEKTEFIKVLNEVHFKEWENVHKAKAIGSVKNFALSLQKTAEKYGDGEIMLYSGELLEAANLFKVAKVKTILNEFPKLIEKLKHSL